MWWCVDPVSADAIHKNNVRRVIRALEIYDATGIPKSVWDEQSRRTAGAFTLHHITLDAHVRERLYERTDARVDAMLREGLLDEVRALYESGRLTPDTTAAQAIGYKELLGVLHGTDTLAAATEQLKLATRHYVKRQLTWFSRMEAYRLYIDREDGTLRPSEELLADALAYLATVGLRPCGDR